MLTFEAARKFKGPNESVKAKMTVIEGIHIDIKNVQGLLSSLHSAISPLVSVLRAQSYLLTEVEMWTLKESNILAKDGGYLVDLITIEQTFGLELEVLLEESKVQMETEEFMGFLIRLLRMAEQRNLVIPRLTPESIVYEKGIGFKLHGPSSGLCSIYNTQMITDVDQEYSIPPIFNALNSQDSFLTIDEWWSNGRFSTGMTILQYINKWERDQVIEFHQEYTTQNFALIDRFPSLDRNILKITTMLLKGSPISTVAFEYESYSKGCFGISTEDFTIPGSVATADIAWILDEKNKLKQEVDELRNQLDEKDSNYEDQLAELEEKLRDEMRKERMVLEKVIPRLKGETHLLEKKAIGDLTARITEIVTNESRFQTTQILAEFNNKVAQIVKKQSDQDCQLVIIGRETTIVKQNLFEMSQIIRQQYTDTENTALFKMYDYFN
eukprot:TRINITY_DN13005_c0_g1_i3.p1 TRINITY_DN13005_c0_g1~~TRINITY_DN13005_c0_g1_i3.p1  ORF type:complete len:440 (+),score=96.10 TRINITY_DN13005_c0_g1_i3:107-1426(+)